MIARVQAIRVQLTVCLLACILPGCVVSDDQERVQAIVREREDLSRQPLNVHGLVNLRRTSSLSKLLRAATGEAKDITKGILFPSGNHKQLANAYIGARAIRELGCSLPIEIAVYGSSERPDAYHARLLKVSCSLVLSIGSGHHTLHKLLYRSWRLSV